jgi:uncharacterized DUF497 family protein
MDFEFDSGKDRESRRKHGFSLSLGREILENLVHEDLDNVSAFEERWIGYGFADGRLMVCVYTQRRQVTRIISVRRATRREERTWLP